ncbi:hypothetical protein COOONC_05105, partial [Cooperia oncophora]
MGGGVCILLHRAVTFEAIEIFAPNLLADVICIDVSFFGQKRRFLLVYRPPSSPTFQDDRLLSILFELSTTISTEVTVVGDFNLSIDWELQRPGNPTAAGSDHNIISFALRSPVKCTSKIRFRNFRACNKIAISQRLLSINWLDLFNGYDDVSDVYNRFCCVIERVIDEFVPISEKNVDMPTYPPHILNLIEQKTRLFRTLNDPMNTPAYLDICKKLDKHIKRYLDNKVKRLNAQKKFSPILLNEEGFKCIENCDKAEALANYFSSVFRDDGNISDVVCNWFPDTMPDFIIEPHTVAKHLRALKPSLSSTSDKIPQYFFKSFALELSVPLAHIFNISLMLGQVPDLWKTALVTPLPKIPNAKKVSDYRPISILPAPVKVLEKIMREHLLSWLTAHKHVPPDQHGFVSGASTCTQLVHCTHKWWSALNSGC